MGTSEKSNEGHVLHWARAYDALVWLLTRGREAEFREGLLSHARLQPGESVLDVGCGTGSLAIAAKRHVGPTGQVYGVDPSPEMTGRARRKARKAGVGVGIETAAVEELPFPEATFDVVLSSLMLHHLSEEGLQQGVREIARVVRPGGRFLAVDIGGGTNGMRHGLFFRIRRHADFDVRALVPALEGAGFGVVEEGPVGGPRIPGLSNLRFLLATHPRPTS